MDEYVYILAGRVLPERALLDISSVGWVDAVPTQHLLHQMYWVAKRCNPTYATKTNVLLITFLEEV